MRENDGDRQIRTERDSQRERERDRDRERDRERETERESECVLPSLTESYREYLGAVHNFQHFHERTKRTRGGGGEKPMYAFLKIKKCRCMSCSNRGAHSNLAFRLSENSEYISFCTVAMNKRQDQFVICIFIFY